ncbi:Hsp20/alpha crystallin family protein [Dyella lutea]|uniref:Hsp20/alpha crystallin family protein n=1 Tax=Dyella lutea TaxID=2950441 RepID=A0ABT1FD18_9GAMM|nr:Hsp20/alpha crystallin family protein [Dyella lutea]MCP1375276.1 Hsp20/alpha crystallin family protein [Dyella lutea]
MSTLTHWNPFKSPARIDPLAGFPLGAFDDVFRPMASRAFWRDVDMIPEMRLDVSEKDEAYVVKADIPGVDKNDIEISVDGGQVAISAEARHSSEKKENEHALVNERYVGRVFRAFSLPAEVDSSKAEARYEGGVLTLTLPKKPNGSSQRIAVK